MQNSDIQISQDYAKAVFERSTKQMPPYNFVPNFGDQPSRFKTYHDVERVALPTDFPDKLASMADILERISTPQIDRRGISSDELAMILQFAHGALSRRLRVTWNQDARSLAVYHFAHFAYARGTPSGGGMYPTEIYWASGASGTLVPGVYHYDNAHHALARLSTGDVTQRIQAALFEHPLAMQTDQFLLISLNFWKNAFKYNSFCYHVVTQDLGALLCSLRLMATGFHSDLSTILWYRDDDLNRLIGLEKASENVFAVVPVPMGTNFGTGTLQTPQASQRATQARVPLQDVLVDKASFQRSKRVIRFETNENMHEATLITNEERPGTHRTFQACVEAPSGSEKVELPPPDMQLLQKDLLETFLQRRSSFGSFSAHVPLTRNELATLLYFGSAIRQYMTDLKQVNGKPHFTRLMVFINNVDGIEPGAYAYDQERHCLWLIQKGDLAFVLQKHYFLQNYNLTETGVLIAIVGSVDKMLAVYGNRGYRLLNAEVGMVAQGLYMAATAMSVACGAALGFDNIALNTLLGLDDTGQQTLLFLMAGHERQQIGDFNYRLV